MRKLVRAPRVQGELPKGPPKPPPNYDRVRDVALAGGELEEATKRFYTTAREEWSDIAGTDLSFRPHRFR